ncbi:MAG: hypothetical protein ACQGVK_04060 [Myxococcota bacterium]
MGSSPPPAGSAKPPPLERLGVFAGIVAGLVGLVVSILCVAVPLLHFVLGPLGPIIGGFVAGRVGGGGLHRTLVGALTMAVGMTLIAAAFTGVAFGQEVTGWVRFVPAIVFLYTGVMATVGAFVGTATAPSR